MKKTVLFVVFLFCVIVFVCPSVVQAETFEDYSYVVTTNGNVEITKYQGSGGDVIIPSEINGMSVTSIGGGAFKDCSSLTSISIPESVTSIGDFAFDDCSSLTSISIPESVTSIEYRAFSGCSSLTSISIPESVTSIGDSAFKDCSSVTSISIPESVTSIRSSAFWGCSSVTSISIPESVTSIESYVFYGCSSVTSISIPESVTSIGYSAFYGCSSVTSISIPESVTSIEYRAFSGCSSLTSIKVEIGNLIYDSRGNCNAIIKTASNTIVTGCINTTIPSSVTSIGSHAFYGCSSLTSISIPESVTSIGDSAFEDCSSVTSISIPESVTSIGGGAFFDCSSLTSISIPESVTSIGDSAFSGCSSLTSISIPESVTSIGSHAFYGCSSLTSISIPESVTSIGDSAFEDCSSLTSISILESVTSIGSHAFYGCSSLTSISIPESVTSIGIYVFYGCSSLTSISIPESVTSIGSHAFYGCSSLTSISIPESVTSIGDSAFSGCSSLTSISILESVTSIGIYAFSGCSSLTSISIPESVTSIGNHAFYGCSSLTDIYYGGSESEWEAIQIDDDGNNALFQAFIHYKSTAPDNGDGGGTHIKPPVQNVTDTAIRKISGIYHDTLADADVEWSADFGWDYFVNSKDGSSTEYNRELAKVSLALCASLEDSFDRTKEILEGSGGRGLECTVGKTKFEELSPAIAIANKSIVYPDGTFTRIFIIVLRGTTTDSDIWNDVGSGLFWNNWGAEDIEEYISDYISGYGVTTENTKFLVTGHSLGGACANLVARDLSEAFGTENVFAYTFATPSPYQRNVSGNYDNIYTFLCCQDNVPLCLVGRSNWYGYGRRVWFNYYEPDNPLKERYFDLTGKDWKTTYDDNFLFRLHAPTAYFAYLMEIPKPFDKSNIFYGTRIECPVDVWIYDSGGNLVGHIRDDKVDFDHYTDSVMLAVEGSAKYVYFTRDDAYTFKIVGTDIGTMTYTAFSVDMDTNDVKEEKVYSNVKIEKDKIFTSIVDSNSGSGEDGEGGADISGVQLFVLNDKGKTEKEVLPDGKGTEVSVGGEPGKPGAGGKTDRPSGKNPSVKVEKIKISGISKKIAAGEKIALKAAVSPSSAANKSLTWESGNKKYAAVNGKGVVTLKKAGAGRTVTITASAKDGSGKKASYKIKIMKGIVKDVKISGKAARAVKSGTSVKLKASVKASNGANKALQWKSSNTKYASVNGKGTVTLKKAGKGKTVRITAMATDGSGKKAVVKIKIK